MMRRSDQMFGSKKTSPTLVDLCVQKVIDNIRYLGNVGSVDHHLLERILPHCTLDQLMHVEKASEGSDLSPVTDKLWKKFFEKQFGTNCTNEVIKRMREKRVSFRWMQLYEAKVKEMAEVENEALDRIKQLYKKEDARKQSRQVKVCTKVPPSSKRRFWGDNGYNVSNLKSNIMKKAKIDLLKSQEVKNLAAMKKSSIQRSISQEVKNVAAVKTNSIQRSISQEVKNAAAMNTNSIQRSISQEVKNAAAMKKNSIQRSISQEVKNAAAMKTNLIQRSIRQEVENVAAMKTNSIQRSISSSSIMKTGSISGIGSTSKDPKFTKRRF